MYRLGSNLAIPELVEAMSLCARGGIDSSTSLPLLAEERAEALEDAGAWPKRHD